MYMKSASILKIDKVMEEESCCDIKSIHSSLCLSPNNFHILSLKCIDGEIQIYASCVRNKVLDFIHLLNKLYNYEGPIYNLVKEMVNFVQRTEVSIVKHDTFTQTDLEYHQQLDSSCQFSTQLTKKKSLRKRPKKYKLDTKSTQGNENSSIFKSQSDENAELSDSPVSEKNQYEDCDVMMTDCPYRCGYCEKTFSKIPILTTHLRIVHKAGNNMDNLPLYRCSYCDKVVEKNGILRSHTIVHIANKPYKCEGHCDKAFGTKQQLKRHMMIYQGNLSFRCLICDKAWATKSGLKGHMIVHSAEMNHQCETCGKKFARKSQLTRHSLLHQNERPFICNVCGRSFLRMHDLTRHSAVHETERVRPFQCQQCFFSFLKKSHLLKHISRKHTQKTISIEQIYK